ncbi:MAG: pyridoxal phosphate-dependent aminotransferase [Gammaproteobacteria bacterium]|nr:pyridoxal phosphate-dependent aminotransferase [Gammaproteobacteria bacterium]MYD76701.1 pyridoxal phosphate-dependent aminotransferase [Gammaproteobacteria bacterium]MYJ51505.1 pyridoxal phosphate-dependent aminotransferase [Gammaproteobacteria bacterium]
MQIQSKLPDVGTTIFTVMSKMAQEHGAINLSQGYPDFDPDPELIERLMHHARSGRNQYPPMIGILELRRAISAKLGRRSEIDVDPETEITVTSGATEALFCAVSAVVRPGDRVIVFDPAYDSYDPAVALAGGETVHIPMALPDYRIDWDELEKHLDDRVRMIIINSPSNPSSGILRPDDLDRLAQAIRSLNCFVLSDEVYEHIVFDGEAHASVLTHPELRRRSFAVFSFGKTYHVTGWKIGYCIAPPELTGEFRKIHQFNVFTTSTPMQWALADFLESNPGNYIELPAFYQAKRDLFRSLVAESRFELLPCAGTYFQLADYSRISDMKDTEFASWITQEKGIAVIPLSPFYRSAPDTRIVRFCFAKQDETLAEAARIINAI